MKSMRTAYLGSSGIICSIGFLPEIPNCVQLVAVFMLQSHVPFFSPLSPTTYSSSPFLLLFPPPPTFSFFAESLASKGRDELFKSSVELKQSKRV